jgi:hypothetical protein
MTMRLLLALLIAASVSIVPGAQQKGSKRDRAEVKQPVTTITGILDQTGDDFVVSGEDSMKTSAVLRAQGFSPDNFARFVGNRVEVQGELSSEGERRILLVKSLHHLKKLGPAGTGK